MGYSVRRRQVARKLQIQWSAFDVDGGFDSHILPPIHLYQGFGWVCCWNHNLSGLDKICFQIFLDKIYFRVWGACVPSLYDILDSIPARTFAAPLEPIGLGTPYVESLTSYVTRLAAFHRLQVSVLMHPQLVGYVIPASSQKLNGMEGHAESALRIIEGMTGRPDLAGLTCLPMKDEVSPQRLLADMQRWCPQCYQLQQDSQKPIYDPLMWSLQVATTCLDHGIPVRSHARWQTSSHNRWRLDVQ